MRIRGCIRLILLLTALALLLIGNAVHLRLFSDHLLRLEEQQAQAGMRAIAHLIRERQQRYAAAVLDWAQRAETYQFAAGRLPGYPAANLTRTALATLDLSFVALLADPGRVVEQRWFDRNSQALSPLPSDLLEQLRQLPELGPDEDVSSTLIGTAAGRSYLIASAPVRDSAHRQPTRGLLIFGRELDQALLSDLELISSSRITINQLSLSETGLAAQPRTLEDSAVVASALVADPADGSATSYLLLNPEQPADHALVAVVTKSLDSYAREMSGMQRMTLGFSVIMILGVLLPLLLVHIRIQRPMARMSKRLLSVDVNAASLDPIPVEGRGELAALARTINGLIGRLAAERERLHESERSKSLLLANLPGMAYRCRYDRDYTMEFISAGCYALTGYRPEQLIGNRDLAFNDIICSAYREEVWAKWVQAMASQTQVHLEYPIITADGEQKWVFEQGQGVYDGDGRPAAIEGLIIDISQQKEREQVIRHISEHDFLTGLRNRTSFERALVEMDVPDNLPLSVVIGDVNGLKIINDAFGHDEGDQLLVSAAEILQDCCRDGDVLARVGGDEFALLLPRTDQEAMHQLIACVQQACDRFNQAGTERLHFVSIALGGSTKVSPQLPLRHFSKLAEDAMYKRKLLEGRSLHSSLLASMRAALAERSQETDEHAARLVALSQATAELLGLSDDQLTTLELFAMLHDLGKIGVDNKILNKPGPLSPEEWVEMKKHSEIGYRIAMSSQELMPIAEFVRSHHERWDGSGYPDGLAGERIPLLARILAVVDAYDAMTSDRPYRLAMTQSAALAEIRRSAGSQFDPQVVQAFLQAVGA